jgi:uncharacterized protein DUF4124
MRRRLFTLMSLVCSLALAATVYKWVDENGIVHYSDQPHPNAQKIGVQPAQTYKAGEIPAAPGGPPAPPAAPPPPPYRGCAIAQPTDDQTFTSVDSLSIVVRTDPALEPGDQIFLTLDGQPLNGGVATGSQFTLTPVDRGTHTLRAVVRDSDGAVRCQTPGVTYNVQQPSLLNPANPLHH